MRRTFSEGDLTEFSLPQQPPPRRGPFTPLSDPQLQNRRDELVWVFEAVWGEIGWELQTCKKPDDLPRALAPLCGSRTPEVVSVLCSPSTQPGSGADLRRLRKEWRTLAPPRRKAYEVSHEAEERLQRAQAALAQAPEEQRSTIQEELAKREEDARQKAAQYRALCDAEKSLEDQIRSLEPGFAREQLYRFLKSKRYELTPLNLANAVAGLPYMRWRQSTLRCRRAASVNADGLSYQVFKAIRYMVKTASRKAEGPLVEHFQASIPLLPHRYKWPESELAENWFYLESAIRESCRAKPHPKSLPFEITKRHLRKLASHSQADMVLAERSKLVLPKRTRERRGELL